MKRYMAGKKNDVDKYSSIQKCLSIVYIYIYAYIDICMTRSVYIILLCEKSRSKVYMQCDFN